MASGRDEETPPVGESGETALPPAVALSAIPAARFAFVDGLRGLAALSIVVFHIWWYEPAPKPALDSAHWVFEELFMRTRGGVQILLVISGFVIAYTLRKTWFNRSEVISFLGRRLVRLVPAYWMAILVVILVDAFCRYVADLPPPLRRPPVDLANDCPYGVSAGHCRARSAQRRNVDAVH